MLVVVVVIPRYSDSNFLDYFDLKNNCCAALCSVLCVCWCVVLLFMYFFEDYFFKGSETDLLNFRPDRLACNSTKAQM